MKNLAGMAKLANCQWDDRPSVGSRKTKINYFLGKASGGSDCLGIRSQRKGMEEVRTDLQISSITVRFYRQNFPYMLKIFFLFRSELSRMSWNITMHSEIVPMWTIRLFQTFEEIIGRTKLTEISNELVWKRDFHDSKFFQFNQIEWHDFWYYKNKKFWMQTFEYLFQYIDHRCLLENHYDINRYLTHANNLVCRFKTYFQSSSLFCWKLFAILLTQFLFDIKKKAAISFLLINSSLLPSERFI